MAAVKETLPKVRQSGKILFCGAYVTRRVIVLDNKTRQWKTADEEGWVEFDQMNDTMVSTTLESAVDGEICLYRVINKDTLPTGNMGCVGSSFWETIPSQKRLFLTWKADE